MNDNYDGTNQSDTDSSNTYGSSPYQDPSKIDQTPSKPEEQTYDNQFSSDGQQFNQPMNDGQQFYNQPANNGQDPYSQSEAQQPNPYSQPNYIPNDYNNQSNNNAPDQNYNPYASNQNQFNQDYYQNNMNQMPNQQYNPNAYSTNGTPTDNTPNTKSKKSHKWMWAFTAIPVLAIAAILCFFFIPGFQNFVYKKALGTTIYYEHIESSCTEKVKDELANLPKTKKVDLSKGTSAKGTLSFKLDSSLTSTLGVDVNDFSCDYSTSAKDKKAIASYKLKYKEKELGTVELYNDTEAGKMYVKVPQLSDQYIDYSALINKYYSSELSSDFKSKIKNLSTENTASTSASYTEIQKMIQKLMTQLDSDEAADLIKGYAKFIIDSIGDKGAIQLNDKDTLRVGNLEQDCDTFTITLTPAQVVEVIKEVLTKAKEDQKLLDIVKNVMDDPSSFTTTIDKLLDEIENSRSSFEDAEQKFVMRVYTDGEQILGRKFMLYSSDLHADSFEYSMLTTKDMTSFNVAITPDDMSNLVSFTYDSKKNDDKYTGSLFFIVGSDEFTIDFNDFKMNDDAIMEGNFNTTVSSLYNVSLDLSNNNGSQGITAAISVAGKEMGSITAEAKREELTEFSYPEISDDQAVTITDNASLAAYLKESKLASFLDSIISTFNLPSTIDGTTLANEIISKLETGSSSSLPDSNGSYNPSDYNLPSGTEIDSDGSYMYDLSDAEIADLKKKGSDYKSFGKTYDKIESFAKLLGKSFCGPTAYYNSDTTNNVIGNVKDNYKFVSHTICYSTICDSADHYIDVTADSLNNQVVQFSVTTKDSKKMMDSVKDICSQLGIAEVPADTLKAINDLVTAKKETIQSYKLKDYYLHFSISTPEGKTRYSMDFTKTDTLY